MEVIFFPWFLEIYDSKDVSCVGNITISAPVGSFVERRKLVACARQMWEREREREGRDRYISRTADIKWIWRRCAARCRCHFRKDIGKGYCNGDSNQAGRMPRRSINEARPRLHLSQDKRYRWNCWAQIHACINRMSISIYRHANVKPLSEREWD